MPELWWRLANNGNGQPGPVQTLTLEARPNGQWGVVDSVPPDTQIEISTVSATGPWTAKRTRRAKAVPGSIAIIKTSPGGRPNWVPMSYWKSVRKQLLDPLTHPMPMGIQHHQIASGRFSDPATWLGGAKPVAGSTWWGANGMRMIYDEESDVIYRCGGGPIGWTWTVDKTRDTRLRIGTWMNMGITDYDDPASSATRAKVKHEIIIHPVEAPGASTKIGFMPMGPTRVNGAEIEANLWLGVLAGQTLPGAPAGADIIHVPGGVAAGWDVGHEVWVGATEYTLPATTDPDYTGPASYWGYNGQSAGMTQVQMNEFQFSENEMVRITEVLSGDRFRIHRPLAYSHFGVTRTRPYSGETATLRPRVVNTFKSIVFRSASAEEDGAIDPTADLRDLQKRGHFMPMFCPDMAFKNARFKNLGRSDTDPTFTVPDPAPPYRIDMAGGAPTVHPILNAQNGTPLANPNNVTGRWAFHIHECGGPFNATEHILIENCVMDAPDWAPPVPGWVAAIHNSRASVERCAFINGRGAGLVTEVGNEIGQAVGCVAMGMRGDGERLTFGSRGESYTKHNDHAGVGFGMQSRAFLLRDCDSVGCKYAVSWHAQKTVRDKRLLRAIDLRLAPGAYRGDWRPPEVMFQEEGIIPASVQIPPMKGVNGWACRFGISVIHRGGDVRKWDNQPGLFERCDMVSVPFPTEVPQYSSDYLFMDSIWIGPLNMMSNSSRAANMGAVSWGFSFTGNLIENYRFAFFDDGMGLNHKGIIAGNVLVNCTDRVNTVYRSVRGDHISRDSHGPWIKHPDDAAIPDTSPARWQIRNYTNHPFSALPLGYPLAPLGVDMPAGAPPVARGQVPVFYPHADMSLTLTGAGGRDRTVIRGTWVDCAGPVNWPEWNSSESFPAQISKRTTTNLGKLQPEQLIAEQGCWQSEGVWRVRVPLPYADRVSHVRAVYNLDFTIDATTFDPAFLAANDLGGPPPQWVWPDQLELVRYRPLRPVTKAMRFLSNLAIDVVAGQPLAHEIVFNSEGGTVAIEPGGDAASFELANMGRTLRFASNGTRSSGTLSVTLRVTDWWGNTTTAVHRVRVVPSERVVTEFALDKTPGPLNPLYLGARDAFEISAGGNVNVLAGTSGGILDMGSIGSRNHEVIFRFPQWSTSIVLFRMEDENNWLGISRRDDVARTRLLMCVAGTITTIAEYTNVSATQAGVRVDGDRLVLTMEPAATAEPVVRYPRNQTAMALRLAPMNELHEPGLTILPANAPQGTKIGLRTGGTGRTDWLSQLTARRI